MIYREFVMTMGLPASGKTTFIQEKYKDFEVVSFDSCLMELAEKLDINYNNAFYKLSKDASIVLNKKINALINAKNNFIIDGTNLTKNKRTGTLSRLTNSTNENWYKTLIFFNLSTEEQEKRQKLREKNDPNKIINRKVIDNMKNSLEEPSLNEGWDQIIIIDDTSEYIIVN